jgi:hypothetical protein
LNTFQSELNKKIHSHLVRKIKTIDKKFKGRHNFLNNLFFSPGDEYYGFFDKSHTYKAIATLQNGLEMEDYRFVLTDIMFEPDMSLMYLFDLETKDGDTIHSIFFNTSKSTMSVTEPRFLIA